MRAKITFDISLARLVHLDWLVRIETAMNQGPGTAPAAVQYFRDCDLGVWLHGDGRRRYRESADIKRLTIEHRRFHHAVEHALIALHDGDKVKTREHLVEAQHISKDIVYLLTLVELQNLEASNRPSWVGAILSSVGSIFESERPWLEPPSTKNASASLDITYARLAHLQWAKSLDRSFRSFGRGGALRSHDRCEFGTWINKVGLKKYGDIPEIGLLDIAHRDFHEAAAQIVQHLQNRRLQRADEAYADVLNLSREIAYLLTLIEFRLDDGVRRDMLGSNRHQQVARSPGCPEEHEEAVGRPSMAEPSLRPQSAPPSKPSAVGV